MHLTAESDVVRSIHALGALIEPNVLGTPPLLQAFDPSIIPIGLGWMPTDTVENGIAGTMKW